MAGETNLRLAASPTSPPSGGLGNMTQICESSHAPKKNRRSFGGFAYFPMMACGAKGVISVTPISCRNRSRNGYGGSQGTGKRQKDSPEIAAIHNAMFLEANPVPVKTAAALMGKCEPHLRLPLAPLSAANLDRLKTVMKQYQLI